MTVFTDPAVQEALADFVPVALMEGFTQYHGGRDELSEYFWKVVRDTPSRMEHFLEKGNSQGHYAFDAAGRSLGGSNSRSNNIDDPTPSAPLLYMLANAKRIFDAEPPAALDLPPWKALGHPRPPDGTVVVQTYTRILPLPKNALTRNERLGRDTFWILRRELNELRNGQMARSLWARLFRYGLNDNVRSNPKQWEPDDVKFASIGITTSRDGDLTRYAIEGTFHFESPRLNRPYTNGAGKRVVYKQEPAGFEGTLVGEIVYDERKRALGDLHILAEGRAWGQKTNADGEPQGRYPVQIAFVMSNDPLAAEITPHPLNSMRWEASPQAYYNPNVPQNALRVTRR